MKNAKSRRLPDKPALVMPLLLLLLLLLLVLLLLPALCVPWSVAAAASAIGSQQACAQAKCELFSCYVEPETKNTHKTKVSHATRLDASQSQRQQREIIKFSHAGVKY